MEYFGFLRFFFILFEAIDHHFIVIVILSILKVGIKSKLIQRKERSMEKNSEK